MEFSTSELALLVIVGTQSFIVAKALQASDIVAGIVGVGAVVVVALLTN